MTTDLTRFAHSIFQAQPFSMFLGAELSAVGPDSAEIRVNRPEIQQQHGFVHG
ncbi:PaaI family thioesterase [Streptomyces sp. BBFR115]|uniref:PaaI family thioesterase n=1 Tax=Streptomyces sp. BBFR115 TaxID=3448173 RepID=UPI003F76E768